MGERCNRTAEVRGSIPLSSTTPPPSTDIDEPAAIPAATLIVTRDRIDGGVPDILMVERAAAMAFAGGAMVFPGGRVDAADRAFAHTLADDDADDHTARITAIRETIEEAGLPIGVVPTPTPGQLATMRRALLDGTPIAEVLAAEAMTLDLSLLEPFARWRPPPRGLKRRFDTRFYLARLPADSPVPQVDGTENVRLCWASAASVLRDAAAGRLTVIFPTLCNLQRLALFASHDAAVAHARVTPQRVVVPWGETRDGEDYLCIPDDLGYPVTAQRAADMRRG